MNIEITQPVIIEDDDSLYSLLEYQEEEFEMISDQIRNSPIYFKEARQSLFELNVFIDDYIANIQSVSFTPLYYITHTFYYNQLRFLI